MKVVPVPAGWDGAAQQHPTGVCHQTRFSQEYADLPKPIGFGDMGVALHLC